METGITVRAHGSTIIVSVDGRIDGEMMHAVCTGIVALDVPVVLDVSAVQMTDPHVAIAIRDSAQGAALPSVAVVAGRLPARRILKRWTAGAVGIYTTVAEAVASIGTDDGPLATGGHRASG